MKNTAINIYTIQYIQRLSVFNPVGPVLELSLRAGEKIRDTTKPEEWAVRPPGWCHEKNSSGQCLPSRSCSELILWTSATRSYCGYYQPVLPEWIPWGWKKLISTAKKEGGLKLTTVGSVYWFHRTPESESHLGGCLILLQAGWKLLAQNRWSCPKLERRWRPSSIETGHERSIFPFFSFNS